MRGQGSAVTDGSNQDYREASVEALGLDATAITRILNESGDSSAALERVFTLVYAELKPIARRMLAGSRHHTLSPTVMVHEAYAKLIGSETLNIEGRRHFFALCARTMRQIVVDYARSRVTDKRGGGQAMASFDEEGVIDLARPESLVAMDEALRWMEDHDPRLVNLIHLRVYVGMELAEISELLEVTPRQLQRDWLRARAWLSEALLGERGD